VILAIINIIIIVSGSFWVWKRQAKGIQALFWPAWIVKLGAGLAMGWIYQYYYSSGDTIILFNMAQEKTASFFNAPRAYLDFIFQDNNQEWKGVARSIFLVKIISIVNIFTGSNYWITSLWFSLFSFLSSIYLVSVVCQSVEQSKMAAAFAFLFFPSVVFWGSGIIKESLALTGLLLLSVVYLKIMLKQRLTWQDVLWILPAGWILWGLKYYWAAVFLPVVITSLAIHFSVIRWPSLSTFKVGFWIILFIVICFGVSFIHPNFYPTNFLNVLVGNHDAYVVTSGPGDLVHYNQLQPTGWSILTNSPAALIAALFRPFVWEADNILKSITAFENLIILVLTFTSLARLRNVFRSKENLIPFSMVAYIILLGLFLALSTPNLGTLARYKVGFMPFFIFLIVYRNPLVESLALNLPKKLKNN
jgi:hypothetical protein